MRKRHASQYANFGSLQKQPSLKEFSFACSKQQSLPLGCLGQFHIRAWCPSKNRPEDLCVLYALCIGQIHSEILQGFLMVFDLHQLPAVIHVMLPKFLVITFVLQDMVHNLQYLVGQCHQGSLFAPACCQSLVTL